jgi:hypothetical protein
MKRENKKLGIIGEIYAQFTEKNKEKLIKTATRLLKVQKEDTKILADASIPPMEAKRQGKA